MASDILGAGLLTVAIGALALGLVQADEWGWTSAGVLGSFAVAVVLAVWFVIRSRNHPSPVVELPLLRVPSFSLPTIAMLFTVAFLAMISRRRCGRRTSGATPRSRPAWRWHPAR